MGFFRVIQEWASKWNRKTKSSGPTPAQARASNPGSGSASRTAWPTTRTGVEGAAARKICSQ